MVQRVIVRDAEQYRRYILSLPKKLRGGLLRGQRRAANLVITNAKKLAPVRTGETIRNFRAVKLKNRGYSVQNRVQGPFKQNLWANQSSPFKAPAMRWNNGQPTKYGSGPANYTGTPRFFDRAVNQIRKRYGDIIRRSTERSLVARTRR